MTEAFLYTLSVGRLRDRAFRAGLVFVASAFLPIDVVAGHPIFLWQALPARPPASAVALLAPVALGLLLVAGARLLRRGVTLAVGVLVLLAIGVAAIHFGESAAAWEALSLPPAVTERPYPALLALAASSAGIHLTFKPDVRRLARGMLWAGLVLAGVFYAVPVRGQSPAQAMWALVTHLRELPSWRFQLGYLVLVFLLAWPGLVALLAQRYQRVVPDHEQPALALWGLYGLPVALGMMLYRGVPFGAPGWTVVTAGGQIALLAVLLALTCSGLEVLGEALVSPAAVEAELELPAGAQPRRVLAAGVALFAVTTAGLAVLAAPPVKGVEWTLTPATEAGDTLYRTLVPAWNAARWTWDARVRQESGASELLAVRRAGREVVEAAKSLSPGLADALSRLVEQSQALDLAGRVWYRLVGDVNEAARAAGLPYYLDPTVYEYADTDGIHRHFRVRSYRIGQVNVRHLDGQDLAALHVSAVGEAYESDARLGFSRDLQPFALVATDEIATWLKLLGAGKCGVEDADAESMAPCDALLVAVRSELPAGEAGLGAAIEALTDRHEMQHQLDGPALPLPAALTRETPYLSDALRHRVNRELSAYLMEMTTPEAPPALTLAQLYPFALGGGSAEHFVAVFILGALSGERVAETESGEVDEAAVARAFTTVAGWPPDTLRTRSEALWHELY